MNLMLHRNNSSKIAITNNLYKRLEFLRGFAALMVLVDHSYTAYLERFLGVSHIVSHVMAFIGMHSVVIFFLLSDYLIALSCKKNFKKTGILMVENI